MSKFLHITEVQREFETLSYVPEYPIGMEITPENGKITVFMEDMTYDQRAEENLRLNGYKFPSRITMASYLDKYQWRMTGTDNNKFDIPHCTFKEIVRHTMYLKKGYNPAEFKSNPMSKRIWYHKALKLMMIQYLNVEETEDKNEDNTKEDQDENEEEPHTEEPPPKEPTIEEPPQQEPPTSEETENQSNDEIQSADINFMSSNVLLDNINFLMTTLSAELPDLGHISDTLLPLHTSTPIHEPQTMVKMGNMKQQVYQCIKDGIYALQKENQEAPNQAEIEATIDQELQDFECKQQEESMQQVKKNYNKIKKARKDSLIKRIGWKTKYIR